MTSHYLPPRLADDAESPFPTVVLDCDPDSEDPPKYEEYYMYMSADIYLIPVSLALHSSVVYPPQETHYFQECADRIELERMGEDDGSMYHTARTARSLDPFKAIDQITESRVRCEPGYDDCAIRLTGYVFGCQRRRSFSRPRPVQVLLIARTEKERNQWLAFLRLRLAPWSLLGQVVRESFSPAIRQSNADLTRELRGLIDENMCAIPYGNSSMFGSLSYTSLRLVLRSIPLFENAASSAADVEGGICAMGLQSILVASSLTTLVQNSSIKIDDSFKGISVRLARHGLSMWQRLVVVLSGRGIEPEHILELLDWFLVCWEALINIEYLLLRGEGPRIRQTSTTIDLDHVVEELDGFETSNFVRIHLLKYMEAASNAVQNSEQEKEENDPTENAAVSVVAFEESKYPVRLGSSPENRPYKSGVYIRVKRSTYTTLQGSLHHDMIRKMLLEKNRANDSERTAVFTILGEGGSGKTTACLLALQDEKVHQKYADGVFAIEIGYNAKSQDLIRKVARIVRFCNGYATANRILLSMNLEEAAEIAREFFAGRRILLFLDNIEKGIFLEPLLSVASDPRSCVVFTTRSPTIATNIAEEHILTLGTPDLRDTAWRNAATSIFWSHLKMDANDPRVGEPVVDKALEISGGLPLSIATLAALVRNRLRSASEMGPLDDMKVPFFDDRNTKLQSVQRDNLFFVMDKCLEFLDEDERTRLGRRAGAEKVMTERFASLYVLNRSHNCINKHLLSYLWRTNAEDADRTASAFFELGLATYARPEANLFANRRKNAEISTLTMHDLQAEYSLRLCTDHQSVIGIEQANENFLQGLLLGPDATDTELIDTDRADYVSQCESLYRQSQDGVDKGGRYIASNLIRHLIESLRSEDAERRWRTIRKVLLDARWLFLWQHVDGWAFVCEEYVQLVDGLIRNKEMESLPRKELNAVSEIGRAARNVRIPGESRLSEDETNIAAAELFRRLHAIWQERPGDLSVELVESMLASLYDLAGEWWLRPASACHERAHQDGRLLTEQPTPRVNGCALISVEGDIVVGNEDGLVQLIDKHRMVVAKHNVHSDWVDAVCVGRGLSNAEHRVFSVSDDGTIARWDVIIRGGSGDQVHTANAVIMDRVEEKLWTVACSEDGSVVAASGPQGHVYLWVLDSDEGLGAYSRRFLAWEHTGSVWCVAVSSDGATVLSGSRDGTCRVWRVADTLSSHPTATAFDVLPASRDGEYGPDRVCSCLFADEDRVAVVGYENGCVCIWRLDLERRPTPFQRRQETFMKRIELERGAVTSLAALGGSGLGFVAGTESGTVLVVTAKSIEPLHVGRGEGEAVDSVSTVRGDGHVIACAHRSGRVMVWDLSRVAFQTEADKRMAANRDLLDGFGSVCSVSSSLCGRIVASGHKYGTICCWHGRTGQQLWKHNYSKSASCVCVSADAMHIACGCIDGTILVVLARTGRVVRRWKSLQGVFSVSLHNLKDGLVWSGHSGGQVMVWKRSQSQPVYRARIDGHDCVYTLAIGVDASFAYARDGSGRILHLHVAGDDLERATVAPGARESGNVEINTDFYENATALGYRTAGTRRLHARAHNDVLGERYDLSVRVAQDGRELIVSIKNSNRGHVISRTANFDTPVWAVDAALSLENDKSNGTAHVVCGLEDGRVCILWQPLTPASHQYNSKESWQQYVGDEKSLGQRSGQERRTIRRGVLPSPIGCLHPFK